MIYNGKRSRKRMLKVEIRGAAALHQEWVSLIKTVETLSALTEKDHVLTSDELSLWSQKAVTACITLDYLRKRTMDHALSFKEDIKEGPVTVPQD